MERKLKNQNKYKDMNIYNYLKDTLGEIRKQQQVFREQIFKKRAEKPD